MSFAVYIMTNRRDGVLYTGMTDDLMAVGLGIQTHMEDFDNDTFLDILFTGRDGEHRLFINNGDMTFTAEEDPFPTGGPGIQSAVVGDLNADGFPDILAGFATGFNNPSDSNPDRLFLNPGNDNNWLDVRLTGVESNISAVGARVELHGEWGVMIREVRAGEAYGIVNSFTRHFGLGSAETIDQVVVRWPSGHVDTSDNPAVLNEQVHIIEGCGANWYPDTDGDGFGDPDAAVTGCLPPQGHVEDATDCDDTDAAVSPDAEEVCDGVDNDCNGEIDDGLTEPCNPGGSGGGADTTAGDDNTPGDASGGVDTDGGTGGTAGDAGAADDGDGGGCACDASSGNGGAGFTLLGLGLLFGLRRRRLSLRARD